MFEKIIGNKKNKEILEKIVLNASYSHSYMFIGQNGIGKFLFAKQFANKALRNDNENNPNLRIVDFGQESIKNDIIKEMNKTVYEKPIDSDKKVYIINNADNMTEEAQNSFLKTLEEPPQYVIIILVVKNEAKLLNTIKSRCTKVSFQKLSDLEVKQILQQKNIQVSESLLSVANGSIENIINLKENEEVYLQVQEAFQNIENVNILDFIKIKEKLITKENCNDILEFINTLFYKNVLDNRYIECIKITEKTKDRLRKNCNFDMTIDNFLFSVWEEINV